jgi:hypothetical protein
VQQKAASCRKLPFCLQARPFSKLAFSLAFDYRFYIHHMTENDQTC